MSITGGLIGGGGGGGLSEAQVDARVVAVTSGGRDEWIPIENFVDDTAPPAAIALTQPIGGGGFAARYRGFSASVDNRLFVPNLFLKRWDAGAINLYCFWTSLASSDTGNVTWSMSAKCFGDGDSISSYLSSDITVNDAGQGANKLHISPAMTITPGSAGKGKLVSIYVKRAGGSDSFVAVAGLLGVLVEYTTDAPTDD